MIKNLRMKLIAVAMLSMCIVLFIIMGAVNVLNYHSVLAEADEMLSVLSENNGRFPEQDNRQTPMGAWQSAEAPYETRFFSVLLSDAGNVLAVDTRSIAAVDLDTAQIYAQSIAQAGKTAGFLHTYRYLCTQTSMGRLIVFVDCSRSLRTFHTFLLVSTGASVLGLLAVFALLVLLSGRIVKPIAESYEKQKRFITDASHELKTPVTIIAADAEILEMDLLEDNEWISDIQTQVKRLTTLTQDLTFLARMDESDQPLIMLEFPLSDLVQEMAHSFEGPARVQNKTLVYQIQPMLSCMGNEAAIRQLLSILLENALKYSDENGRISVSLERKGNWLQLTVWNSTDVLDTTMLPHLFDRFYRMEQSRNSQTGGHGLGLAIAQAVVTAHKGKISAGSTDQKSLTITVQLPAHSA